VSAGVSVKQRHPDARPIAVRSALMGGRLQLGLMASLAVLLPVCKEDPGPTAGGSAPPPVTGTASPAEPQSPIAPSPRPRAETTWLSVSRGSVELAIIEFRPGLRGVLTPSTNAASAKELQKLWNKLDRPEGIAVDMHLPPESGKGRGAYGSKLFKPGEDGYAMAVEQKLTSADFYVEKVPALPPSDTPPSIRRINITRSGQPVGTLDFTTEPPVLSINTTSSDGLFLKGHWEAISKQESLRVRFHQSRDGTDELVTVESQPGEKTYPNAVRLYLIVKHQYDEQRGYSLTVVP
jgi:hypothetical protein